MVPDLATSFWEIGKPIGVAASRHDEMTTIQMYYEQMQLYHGVEGTFKSDVLGMYNKAKTEMTSNPNSRYATQCNAVIDNFEKNGDELQKKAVWCDNILGWRDNLI